MSKPNTFIAIYVGDTISSAKIVAASSDPHLVSEVAAVLLRNERYSIRTSNTDSATESLEVGRRQALHIIEDKPE